MIPLRCDAAVWCTRTCSPRMGDEPVVYHCQGDRAKRGSWWSRASVLRGARVGFEILYPNQLDADSAQEIKNAWSGRLALIGEFPVPLLANTSTEEIEAQVRETCRRLAPDGGCAIGSSMAITDNVPPESFRMAVDAVCYAGRVVYVGYAKKDVCFDTTHFVRKEMDIRGSRNALRVFPAVIKMLESRQQPFEEMISKVYPAGETARALAEWATNPGAFTKILIDMGS